MNAKATPEATPLDKTIFKWIKIIGVATLALITLIIFASLSSSSTPKDPISSAVEKCKIDSRHLTSGTLTLPAQGGPETMVYPGDIECVMNELGLEESDTARLMSENATYTVNGVVITSIHDSFGALYTVKPE